MRSRIGSRTMRAIAAALAVLALVGTGVVTVAAAAPARGGHGPTASAGAPSPLLPGGVIPGIDIEVPTGNEISGTISADGTPLAGATVGACTPDESCRRFATTAGDGTYTVHGLAAGVYFLEVEPPDTSDAFSGWYTSSGPVENFEDAESIDASAGDVADIDLDLAVGHHISGTVLGGGVTPLEDVQVVAHGQNGGGATQSDAAGEFTVHALPDGSYTMEIRVPSSLNYRSGSVVDGEIVPASEDGSEVEIAGGDVIGMEIEPPTGFRLSGTLTGAEASGASVDATGTENSAVATVAPNGHWEVAGLWPDSYQLLFAPAQDGFLENLFSLGVYTGPGALSANEASAIEVVVTTADRTGLNASIPTGVTLSGTVEGDDGLPLEGTYIDACADGVGCVSALTDSNGTWAFRHARAGGYVVQAFDSTHIGGYFGPGGFAVNEALATTVHLATTSRTGVDFRLPTGIAIGGTITGAGGAPVEGARVGAQGTGGLPPVPPGMDTSAADGTYLLEGLAADEYVVGVSFDEDSPLVDGYYAEGEPGNFTTERLEATPIGFDVQGVGGSYVPITPARVADSRTPLGVTGILMANVPQTFPVADVGDIPHDAVAVTGNVTVVGQTAAGFVSVTPDPTATPSSSTINVPLGDVRANNFTSPLADDGSLAVVYKALSGKKSHVIVDITGYFVDGDGAATYNAIDPLRVMDTRPAGHVGSVSTLAANVPQTLDVAAHPSIPDDAVAITGNLTVVGQTKPGFLSLTPEPDATPGTSILNFPRGDIRANGVSVPLNVDGELSIVYVAASGGTANALLDVTGYYLDDPAGLLFYPLPPGRLMDTRSGVLATGLSGSFTSATPRRLDTVGRALVPLDAEAVTGNLTVVGQGGAGFVSITTIEDATPGTSTLNFPLGDIRANGVTVPVGDDGELWLVYRSAAGKKTHLTLDISGYFQ